MRYAVFESTRDIPVVILTNSRDPVALRSAQALNVSAYVIKPLAIEAFVAAVAGLDALREGRDVGAELNAVTASTGGSEAAR